MTRNNENLTIYSEYKKKHYIIIYFMQSILDEDYTNSENLLYSSKISFLWSLY